MKPILKYHDDLLQRLKNANYAATYLNACLDQGDEEDFLVALRDVAQTHGGLRLLSKKTGLNREHLFKMLSKKGNPSLHNIRQIMLSMGFKLMLQAA